MSVKTMSLVWDLDNDIIEREEKYVLLAYADHADHEGNNMFPAIETICKKTGYKERSIQTITRSLEEKGFLIPDGKGPKGTNKWSYGGGAKFAGVQKTTVGGAKFTVEGVQTVAPEPLRTIKEPSDMMDSILQNEVIAQQQKDACIAFESALGFGSLPWSKPDWQKLARWLSETYKKDPSAFTDYAKWRMGDGKYQAMSNNKIRQDPRAFLDTGWPTFLAHSAMQEFRNTPKGKEYQKVVIEQEAIAQNPRRKV